MKVDFGQLQNSIANISGMDRDIQNRKDTWSRAIPPAFGEKSSVNFGPLTTQFYRWTRIQFIFNISISI